MKRILVNFLSFLFMVAFALLMAFVAINFMLGCESWDEQYWTETNSCLTPQHILEGITNE